LLPDADVQLFKKIRAVVLAMEDIDLGVDERGDVVVLSCHILAHAIGQNFRLRVQDGFFAVGYQHSWILTPARNIIDTYPVGILGGPLLVENSDATSPGRRLYEADPVRLNSHLRIKKRIIKRSIGRIAKEICRVRASLE
ncbi:MAG: hypothetical protein V4664_03185, partial [Patescibacteria group bacterium]